MPYSDSQCLTIHHSVGFGCRFLGELISQSGTLDSAPAPAVWGCVLSEQADDAVSLCCTILAEAGQQQQMQILQSFEARVQVIR